MLYLVGRGRHFAVLIGFAISCFSPIFEAQAVPQPPALSRPDPACLSRLDRRFEKAVKRDERLSARELFRLSLEHAALNHKTNRIDELFAIAEEMQDRDETSRTYGNFKWYYGDAGPVDRNSVEFCMHKGILVWMLYRDRLSPESRDRIQRLMTFSVEGIRRHGVRVSYTNIFLMKTFNCIALGETTGRDDLADLGYQMLDIWLLYTSAFGIHEYGSPTYYGVDLDCLGLIARYAGRPEGRKKAETALRLFWTDIAANYVTPCTRIGGAHSRDYDYLTGHGVLRFHLRDLPWSGYPAEFDVFMEHCRFPPPEEWTAVRSAIPRTVLQRWGEPEGEHATHYVGQNFTIGSAAAAYGPMDKPLAINFADGPKMAMSSFFMDARGDPYGKLKFQRATGHRKALHCVPFLMSVQRGAEVLLLASSKPTEDRYIPEPRCLMSHFVIPSEVQVFVNDVLVPGNAPVPPGASVFLRFKDVAVGIRVPVRLNIAGGTAEVALLRDGGKYGAMRLTCSHAAEPPAGRGTVALWVRAAEGLDDDAFAAFRETLCSSRPRVDVADGVVGLAVPGRHGTMRISADVEEGIRLVADGAEPGAGQRLLAVNGRDIGREIMDSLPEIAARSRALADTAALDGPALPANETIPAADAALIFLPFQVSAEADGTKFVYVPNGQPGSLARLLYRVQVSEPGRYYLTGRFLSPTGEDDSFYVEVRQGKDVVLPRTDWHVGRRSEWGDATLREAGKPLAIELETGIYTIDFRCREDGTKMSALCLGEKPGMPTNAFLPE